MAGTVMSIEKRNEILNNGMRRLKSYENVISEIQRGTSEAEACRMYNVNVMQFRNFIRRDYEDTSEYKERPHEKYFTWQDELCAEIFGDKTTACIGFDEAYEYVKSSLTDREAKILDMRYKEGMRLNEVGKVFNVTRERIREIESRALRKLHHPSRSKILYYGLDYKKRIEECERALNLKRSEELNQLINQRYDSYTQPTVFNIGIDELGLSTRVYNCLIRTNIRTLADLVKFSNEYSMSKCRNLGRKSFNELVEKTEQFGIRLRYNVD